MNVNSDFNPNLGVPNEPTIKKEKETVPVEPGHVKKIVEEFEKRLPKSPPISAGVSGSVRTDQMVKANPAYEKLTKMGSNLQDVQKDAIGAIAEEAVNVEDDTHGKILHQGHVEFSHSQLVSQGTEQDEVEKEILSFKQTLDSFDTLIASKVASNEEKSLQYQMITDKANELCKKLDIRVESLSSNPTLENLNMAINLQAIKMHVIGIVDSLKLDH